MIFEKMKVSYEIYYYNSKLKHNQYNTFHNCTLEESIQKLNDKGFDKSDIISIKEKIEKNIDPEQWKKEDECCLYCGEPTNRGDEFCKDDCKKMYKG
jgi:cupin superfamily acireductone dioxygenase involved in methionine salvage